MDQETPDSLLVHLPDLPADLRERLRGFHVRDRHSDDLAAGVLETRDLGDGGGDVRGRCIAHRLDADGLVPAESVFTYFDGQPNDGYYHARDGYRYEPASYDEYLTEQEFNYFVGAWEDSVYIPQLTMIA